MKSNVPWSVKGIDPEARVVAKEAARKAGMTLGEWMTSMIRDVGAEGSEPGPAAPEATAPRAGGVSPDQLRAVVDSLNRLNERLKSTEENLKRTEEKSRDALGGLNVGLETVFDRLKRVEQARADVQAAVNESGLAPTPQSRERLESLKSLERALSHMVDQFETQRSETVARVVQNETAISTLNQRVNVLDQRVTAGFQEVHDALDTVGTQLDHTERTAKSVMLEAQSAANSTDAEFVERTGKKLQLLGNEIKRSGDQIGAVEQMVSSLTKKIEAAETRSAEGIADVAKELSSLREDMDSDIAAVATNDPALRAAAASAEETVASLQKSYDEMIARMEGRGAAETVEASDEEPAPDEDVDPVPEPQAVVADIPDTDIAPSPSISPQDAMRAAMSAVQPGADPRNAEPVPDLTAGNVDQPAPATDDEFDAVFSDTAAPAPDSTDETPEPKPAEPRVLTPREKIIAAAKLRKERVERERAAEEAAAASTPAETAAQERVLPGDSPDTDLDDGQNRKLGLPLLALLALCVLTAIAAAAWFFRGSAGTEASTEVPALTAPAETNAPAAALPAPTPATNTPAAPDGRTLYADAKALAASGDAPGAFALMRDAAIYGNVPAQYRLGEMYMSGTGTDQDFREAKRWFESAALSGNAVSMHKLGSLAINADVGPPQYDDALDWFARAANYGVVDSMYNLGLLYDPTADYLPTDMRNAERSYRYYMLAARQGDEQAQTDGAMVATGLDAATIETLNNEVSQWTPLPIDPRVNDGLSIVN